MSLPRYAFLHKDYLEWYMQDLPRPIFDHVAESFNCEDIAMSFFISSHTSGLPPLLANFWAIESMVKLYSPKRISGSKQHKSLRDDCVESFAHQLHLKDRLMTAPILYRNQTFFYCGDHHRSPDNKLLGSFPNYLRGDNNMCQRQKDHFQKINQWRTMDKKGMMEIVTEMKMNVSAKAKVAGLIEQTKEWEAKFQTK
jgi:Glycosyl transferase family 64 domain